MSIKHEQKCEYFFFFLYKNSTASSVDYKLLESLRVQHMETNIFHLYTIVWVVVFFFIRAAWSRSAAINSLKEIIVSPQFSNAVLLSFLVLLLRIKVLQSSGLCPEVALLFL